MDPVALARDPDSSQAIASRLQTSLPSPSTLPRPIALTRHYRFLRGESKRGATQ